jgi:hypothetical protein
MDDVTINNMDILYVKRITCSGSKKYKYIGLHQEPYITRSSELNSSTHSDNIIQEAGTYILIISQILIVLKDYIERQQ